MAPGRGTEPRGGALEAALAAAYRGAMTSADAYRAVRTALRLDRGLLRLGNRFVPVDRYREIAFVALGHASSSMALAAWESLGERLTRGIVAGPAPLPASVPFRSWTAEPGPPGGPVGMEVSRAVEELAGELGERDLLVVLLSPGALELLARPPPGLTGSEWARAIAALSAAGVPSAEILGVVRCGSDGPVGGRLLSRASAGEVETLVVDRGEGGAAVGGGPTVPLAPDEVERARAVLDRAAVGHPELERSFPLERRLPPAAAPSVRKRSRPVVVLGPADGLRGASDALADRRWSCRLASTTLAEDPERAAARLLARGEELLREAGGIPTRSSDRRGAAGIAVFAGLTLGQLEGLPEEEALDRFLRAAGAGLSRRDAVVAALPTAGSVRAGGAGAGGVARAGGGPLERPFSMRAGLTDVGALGVLLFPAAV